MVNDYFKDNRSNFISYVFEVSLSYKPKSMFTVDNWSKLANRSLRTRTSSGAVHIDEMAVKPTMSANRMLEEESVMIHYNNRDN